MAGVARRIRRGRGPRHSAASLRSSRSPRNRLSITAAFVANVVVAVAKLLAGLFTGSSAPIAEAAHSTADSTNEILLGLSLRRARRPADAEHPFGYGGARFLWAFLAAICSLGVDDGRPGGAVRGRVDGGIGTSVRL
jgi:Co/Zn/Cd efflux system component